MRSAMSQRLDDLGDHVLETKRLKGWTITTPESWADENQVPADLALLHSEVSEALEAFRRDDRAGFAGELADVLIRLLGLSRGLGIDLAAEAWAKAEANRGRPHRHGGKRL